MTTTILTVIGSVLVCGGFWTFIQFLISRNDGKKEAMKELQSAVKTLQASIDDNNRNMALQSEALMSLAQDRILFLAEEYIKQGWIYITDYKNLKRMADAYREMGGNDLVKTEMDLVDGLEKRIK